MDSIGMSCIKYILFFFNLLFSISGLVLIATGVIIRNAYYNYSLFIDDKFSSPPWVLIIVGVSVFVVAFFGCCGAIRESNCMLIMFSILLFIIVLLETLVVLSGFFLQKDISLMIQTKMNASIPDYSDNQDVKKYWDIMQLDLKCCGVKSDVDWAPLFAPPSLPHSCCPDIGIQDNCTTESSSQKGCMDALVNLLASYSQTILIAAGSVALLELIGCLFACCLASSIRSEYETV
uniref:Tetraspanin n=1 Tax=Cacopsylla melanoneura TaxID=428564 RepID=A0A8D9A275_9HEMI